MNKDVKIKKVKTTYTIDEEAKFVYCRKSVVFKIFDDEKHFSAEGIADCAKGNVFNVSFGKALTEIRASQEIHKQLEIALIKYSFDHLLEEQEELTDFLSDVITWDRLPGSWTLL